MRYAMSKNTCEAKPKTEAPQVLLSVRNPNAARWLLPRGARLAGIVAISMIIGGPCALVRGIESVAGTSDYQLAVQLPARIRKGQPASLVLYVQRRGVPVDGVAACLTPTPLFASEEDATDATPAAGIDLGASTEPESDPTDPPGSAGPACVGSIAALRAAPGVYQFTWEPDESGRVNLRFSVGDSQLNKAVNVGSAPPNPAILITFVLLVAGILGAAGHMRRTRARRGDLT